MYLKRMSLIKNLAILQSPAIYSRISNVVNEARTNGVDVLELEINPFIYSQHALEVPVVLPYIDMLCGLVDFFRSEFDDAVYEIFNGLDRSHEIINYIFNSEVYSCIFRELNNQFNQSLYDENCVEYLSFGDTSYYSFIVTHLMTTFTTYTDIYINSLLQTNLKIKSKIYSKFLRTPEVFNSIVNILETMVLPFY